jgi:ribulose-phosphate 3-epimerase
MMTHRPLLLTPSILSADFCRLGEEVRAVEDAGADWIHVDVMDGHFVPNITIGIPVVESLKAVARRPLDVHLMIEDADTYATQFVEAGADRVSVHVEACPHLHRTVHSVKDAGAKVGVVLNPGTAAEAVRPILKDLDHVLLMTVNPGFGGQKFIPEVLPRISTIRNWILEDGLDVDIQVDGGITPQTIGAARSAGANVFVAGSAIFRSQDYKTIMMTMRHQAEAEATP